MVPLLGFLLLAALCFPFLIGLRGVLAALTRSVPQEDSPGTPCQSSPLPYSRRKYFFSAAERSFYEVMRRLVPGCTVFAKVRLADLVYVSKDAASRQSHFNRIQSKHIDFVICDADLAPILAVELDDSSHDLEERKARDTFVDTVLATASLPLVRVRAQRGYALDELRQKLSPYLDAKPPALPGDDSRFMPPLARHASA